MQGYNRNEREGNWRLGVGRQGGVKKENKTLGTERCENIKNLYINLKKIYFPWKDLKFYIKKEEDKWTP